MMTADEYRTSYRRIVDKRGEQVTLRRVNASPAEPTDVTCLAVVSGYRPEELIGGITTGDRRVIVLAEDVGDFPVPFKIGGTDKVIVRGHTLNINVVDDSTRRIGETLIAYEFRCRG